MKTIVTVIIPTAFLFLVTTSASADTLLSNLTEPNSFDASIGSGVSEGFGGIQFLTGSLAPAWSLDSATLEFGGPMLWGATDNGPILYSAYIYSSSSNAPTTDLGSLGSFNFTNQTASVLQVTFNPSSEISISSNSVYWIIVGAVTTCPAGILEGTEEQYNSVPGSDWQFGSFGYYYASGDQLIGSPNPGYTAAFLQIQATVESVPEPFSLGFLGLGAATIVLCNSNKRPQRLKHDHAA